MLNGFEKDKLSVAISSFRSCQIVVDGQVEGYLLASNIETAPSGVEPGPRARRLRQTLRALPRAYTTIQ
jgi:hypothetical protein